MPDLNNRVPSPVANVDFTVTEGREIQEVLSRSVISLDLRS